MDGIAESVVCTRSSLMVGTKRGEALADVRPEREKERGEKGGGRKGKKFVGAAGAAKSTMLTWWRAADCLSFWGCDKRWQAGKVEGGGGGKRRRGKGYQITPKTPPTPTLTALGQTNCSIRLEKGERRKRRKKRARPAAPTTGSRGASHRCLYFTSAPTPSPWPALATIVGRRGGKKKKTRYNPRSSLSSLLRLGSDSLDTEEGGRTSQKKGRKRPQNNIASPSIWRSKVLVRTLPLFAIVATSIR